MDRKRSIFVWRLLRRRQKSRGRALRFACSKWKCGSGFCVDAGVRVTNSSPPGLLRCSVTSMTFPCVSPCGLCRLRPGRQLGTSLAAFWLPSLSRQTKPHPCAGNHGQRRVGGGELRKSLGPNTDDAAAAAGPQRVMLFDSELLVLKRLNICVSFTNSLLV